MNWRAIRNSWLGRPSVRAALGRLPIGRRVAAGHVRHLFGLVAGFAETQMLLAALELGVFELLRERPARWDDLIDLPPAGAAALRQALVAMRLVEDRGGGMTGLTIDGVVIATDPGLAAMIGHNRLLYADLADPIAVLRGGGAGRLAAFWPYDGGAGDAAGYAELMARSQPFVADVVLNAVDFGASRQVMDLGGGDGRFARRLIHRFAHLGVTLVDLPGVVALATDLPPRIEAVGVATDSPLPGGADTITLLRVLHDHDDEDAAALLRRVAAALPRDGRVIVAEPLARRGYDPQTTYFAAYFAAMRSGRLRSASEMARLIERAGLRVRRMRHPSPLASVILAGHK